MLICCQLGHLKTNSCTADVSVYFWTDYSATVLKFTVARILISSASANLLPETPLATYSYCKISLAKEHTESRVNIG